MAEKVRLGKFLAERLAAGDAVEKYTAPERVRMSFEELGPTFVKLGQLLAARPDLVPEAYVREFEKLHDRVNPLPFAIIEGVLHEEFGERVSSVFQFIDQNPLGSASIAQVHRAVLANGESVVIKVQRPGIVKQINDDLDVLYMLAQLLETYVPEIRPYNPVAVVDEFFKTLDLETNFIVEANNIRRFSNHFGPEKGENAERIKIPKVYFELTTERVLVMEALQGVPLSQPDSLTTPGTDPAQVIRTGLHAYLKMVFIDGLFHGDLHAGNFFILPDNHVGLIDFGVVGRLTPKTQTAIASMLLALSREDYERMALEYVDLAPFTDKVKIDVFARELRELIAPYFGLTLKNVNLGKLLMTSAGIAARHHILVPTELMLFFKSIVSIEGLGRRIDPTFDFLQASLEFAEVLAKHQLDPIRVMTDMTQVARETKNFINTLPRQLSFLIRKLNSPEHAFGIDVRGLEDVKKSINNSSTLIFLGLIIGSLVLSASHVFTAPSAGSLIAGIPALSFVLYAIACGLGIIAFFNLIRKP